MKVEDMELNLAILKEIAKMENKIEKVTPEQHLEYLDEHRIEICQEEEVGRMQVYEFFRKYDDKLFIFREKFKTLMVLCIVLDEKYRIEVPIYYGGLLYSLLGDVLTAFGKHYEEKENESKTTT